MTSPPVTLDNATRLAVDRTRLAHERTMMAWVRTATSLISFGFTIYKFFQLDMKGAAQQANALIGPRGFALMMIGIGLAALGMAGVQHYESMRFLKATYGEMPRSVAGPIAALIALMGTLAFVAVVFRA
ncbi:MAG TPA: DUF202 domain-containing protein [Vicinamibacterales bacterium]|nr:DUF202 domain-containing protein [Vicinamibacterales bacterium]